MKKTNQKKQSVVKMPLVHSDAAGIDVGDTIHAVAVPEGRDEDRVRSFGTMTCDLEEIIKWLRQCSIATVAMESTGLCIGNRCLICSAGKGLKCTLSIQNMQRT
jgi:transposase